MVEGWLALIGNMNSAVRDLRQAAPHVMKAFSDMARAAMVEKRQAARPKSGLRSRAAVAET